MNLHEVRFFATRIAIWLQASGQNGRYIGQHLWEVPEGEPPDAPETRPNWYRPDNWNPSRFNWNAFADYRTQFRMGWTPPLCGQRSQSRRPRVHPAYAGDGGCTNCQRIAVERGIMPLTYSEAQNQSPTIAALREERERWVAEGRPSPWPPSPPTS